MNETAFIVEEFGVFTRSNVRAVWHNEPRPPHLELDALIAETWAKRCDQCRHEGIMLFNGLLARYLDHRVEKGVLSIDVGPTDYADFIGTNFLNYDRGDEFGWELFSNAIGTSAMVITSDDWLLLGRRNHKVACLPGYVHPFGGGLEEEDKNEKGLIDPFISIFRELEEELSLEADEIEEMLCIGLIREPQIRQPELIFDAHVRLNKDEITARFRPDHAEQEHSDILACRNNPDEILPFIRSTPMIAAVTTGILCLHGRRQFGEKWYESTLKQLTVAPH